MKDLDNTIFISLFRAACEKCFGNPLTIPLSETESKLLSNQIFEQTGLVIGVKSVKNYSSYVLKSAEAKKENPSIATLDTLARYVLHAPFTDEVKRKDHEDHYPYWFQYRNKFSAATPGPKIVQLSWRKWGIILSVFVVIGIGLLTLKLLNQEKENENFKDNFDSVQADSLANKGWFIKSIDTTWWNKRNEKPGHLVLYTLKGDNWGNAENPARIRNLLMRNIPSDCFIAELHLTNFVPERNWEQAGLLLLEDSTFTAKAIRLSISYNRCWMLDAGCWMLDAGCWMLDAGNCESQNKVAFCENLVKFYYFSFSR